MHEAGRESLRVELPSLLQILIDKRTSLLRAAASITGCYSKAEDVIQDAFIRLAAVSVHALPSKAHLSYVFQVVRNLAIDHYRKQELEHEYVRGDDEDFDAPGGAPTPDDIQQQMDTLKIIDTALNELPSRTRYVFEMYRLHGRQQKEIARELNVSPTLVNFMVRDALIHCKKAVDAAQCSGQ